MSKTIDLQVEKSRSLIEGYRNNLAELQAKGVTAAQLDKMEEDVKKLLAAGEECDRLRAELAEKVSLANAILQTVKDDFLDKKKIVKSSYDQEVWQRYGIHDKR